MKQNIFKKLIMGMMIFSAVILVLAPVTQVMATVDAKTYWGDNTQQKIEDAGIGSRAITDPRLVIVDFIKIALGFLGIIATIIILFAGFKWMTAGGNEENVASAKKMLIAGIIGLVIILSAYALATFIIKQIVFSTTGTTIN